MVANAEHADDLHRFRWHTGAALRPLSPDEHCPVLFRDLGLEASIQLLSGNLTRLAGPLTPLLYARTADFAEPYTDYEATGRVVILRPRDFGFWHSGVADVLVARAERPVAWDAVGFAPGFADQRELSHQLLDVRTADELREQLGGKEHDEFLRAERARLRVLVDELEHTERWARPVRHVLQSGTTVERARARDALAAAGLGESELCTAWHHLPRERREAFKSALPRVHEGLGLR